MNRMTSTLSHPISLFRFTTTSKGASTSILPVILPVDHFDLYRPPGIPFIFHYSSLLPAVMIHLFPFHHHYFQRGEGIGY